ncbi:MAG: HPr family phosphocarrier protein [Pyrinomonadaceae bacterium]
MRNGTVEIRNTLGLHARAAAKLVKTANKFASRVMIRIEDGDVEVNAKSILSVLTLAAAKGTKIVVTAEGMDEDAAFEEVFGLFEARFYED